MPAVGPFLPRLWLILILLGALTTAGGVPAHSANAGTEAEASNAEGSQVQALRQELEELRRQLERLKDEYQQSMEQMKEQLRALEAGPKATTGPQPVAVQPPMDNPPTPIATARSAEPSAPDEPRRTGQRLADEDLNLITAGAAPPSSTRIAQGQAPSAPPGGETPAAEETPLPSPAPPPSPAQPATGEEEEREVTRVPLATIEHGGVLLRPGRFQFETGFDYTYTRNTRLILTGFSVIPLIILGTLESEKLTAYAYSPRWAFRYGLFKDAQFDVTIPTTYIDQSRVRVSNERVGLTQDSTSQFGLGDITAGLTYQVLYEQGWLPDLSLGLRGRFPTGRSAFDIYADITKQGAFLSVEDFVNRLNAEGLPTGAGFWGVAGSLSFVKAFDPAVIYGTISYTYNVPQDVTLVGIFGTPAEGGIILHPNAAVVHLSPGGTLDLSIGFSIALNNQISVNFGFSDSITFNSKQNGHKISDSGLNIGRFSAGFNLALSRRVSLSFTGTIGVTPDSPTFGLGVTVPVLFESITDLLPFLKSGG